MKDEIVQQTLFNYDSSNTEYFKGHLENLQKQLRQFGFTLNLSKVYIYLGKYGPKTAFDIVKALKIPRTETYNLLKLLMNKGVVYSTMQHPMRFAAIPLEKAIWDLVTAEKLRVDSLEKNGENLVTLWRRIPDFLNEEVPDRDDKFQILKGANQIRARVSEIIRASKEIQILGSEKSVIGFYQSDSFSSMDGHGKTMRILVSNMTFMNDMIKELKRLRIKKMPSDVHENLCFVIGGDDLLFYIRNETENPLRVVAFWSNSKLLASSMRMLFDSLWSKS